MSTSSCWLSSWFTSFSTYHFTTVPVYIFTIYHKSCCAGYWYWYLYLHAMMPTTGTCTGTWSAGTGTCEKVLVAKTKSFSAVIDTLWNLYSETVSFWSTGFMSKFHRLSLFGRFAFHKFFWFSAFTKSAINYVCYFLSHNLVASAEN